MRHLLRKADFLLFLFFLAAAALIAVVPLLQSSKSAGQVQIMCEGEVYGIYPLDREAEIVVSRNGHTNVVVIGDRSVHMESADCQNQVCVHTGTIAHTGDTIVCLPNRVVVEIVGDKEGGEDRDAIDAIVK